LLNKTEFSAWHILKSDEIWYFHKGSPLNVYLIDENGHLTTCLLGDPLEFVGATFQVCIKAGTYFSAENVDKNAYSLVGCMVAPGFEDSDFTLVDKNTLLAVSPQHRALIERLSG
jgi:predicted cupin superfamily sugar epimerase